MNKKRVKCVIVSDTDEDKITCSIDGNVLEWKWQDNGILFPGSTEVFEFNALAAESLIEDELRAFLDLYGIGPNDYITVDSEGIEVDFIKFEPFDKELSDKKQKIKELYNIFSANDYLVTPELINLAIEQDVLEPFVALMNL